MIPIWLHYFLSTASFVLTLVFVSFVIRARKPAGSTLAWLFLIFLIPYLGIPLYLFLSNKKFSSRLKRKPQIYRPRLEREQEDHLPGVRKLLAAAGVADPCGNTSIELIETGELAYQKLLTHIQNAQKSISITTFIFANDEVGRGIVSALSAKASAGVEVRVIVDSLGATLIRHPSFSALKKAGGQIAYFMPLLHLPFRSRTNLRNHRKLMVVDDQVAILGGMNLAKEYLGPAFDPLRWTDLAVEIRGDSVAELNNIFSKDWTYANRGRFNSIHPLTNSLPRTTLPAQVIASGPDVEGFPLYDVLLSSIFEAKKRVWIVSPYFIPDESLATALELACKRGIEVKILIPKKSNHLLADTARGSFVRQLETVGAEIHLYPTMIHAKAVLIDQTMALLGSANFDMRSLLLNYELGIIFYDPTTLKNTEKWMDCCLNKAHRGFIPNSFWRELVEGIGRIIGPII
jgi:cardiolipin synthase